VFPLVYRESEMVKKTKKTTPHLRVRMEPELLARLERAREKAGRTLTGEIVHRIERSFQRDDSFEQAGQIGREAALQTAGQVAEVFLKSLGAPDDDMRRWISGLLRQSEREGQKDRTK
jgi:hypothetical protein